MRSYSLFYCVVGLDVVLLGEILVRLKLISDLKQYSCQIDQVQRGGENIITAVSWQLSHLVVGGCDAGILHFFHRADEKTGTCRVPVLDPIGVTSWDLPGRWGALLRKNWKRRADARRFLSERQVIRSVSVRARPCGLKPSPLPGALPRLSESRHKIQQALIFAAVRVVG
jgi:hypothetical protein